MCEAGKTPLHSNGKLNRKEAYARLEYWVKVAEENNSPIQKYWTMRRRAFGAIKILVKILRKDECDRELIQGLV
jgi:hypothetical protein